MASDWQRLSVRVGRREPDGPFEGVPAHLSHAVGEWLRGKFGVGSRVIDHAFMARVATALRIPVTRTAQHAGISNQIFSVIESDEGLYLDCLDAVLHLAGGSTSVRVASAGRLREILRVGGSVWTISDDGRALERRVSAAESAVFEHAASAGDSASVELREAWSQAFGLHPNPSDAWDHAIKAVEETLIPLVVPAMAKANLGSVAGEIAAHPESWAFGLPANGSRGNGETLEGLIRHIWPNPDRHGGGSQRPPTQSEAEAAVKIAVLIVALCRGRLTKK